MSCRENVSEDLDKRPVGLKGLIELEDVLGSKVMRERAGKQLDKSGSLVPDKKDSERGGRLCRELDERCEGLELRLDEGERCQGARVFDVVRAPSMETFRVHFQVAGRSMFTLGLWGCSQSELVQKSRNKNNQLISTSKTTLDCFLPLLRFLQPLLAFRRQKNELF